MKKIIAVTLALFGLTLSVSAKKWTNYVNAGWRIPTGVTIGTENDHSFVFNPITGIDLGYTGVLDNGFSVRAIVDYNYAKIDWDEHNEFGNADILLGAGYAPLHNDQFFLGFYGMAGIFWAYNEYEVNSYGAIKSSAKAEWTFTNAVIGLNTMFVYTPKKAFSVYATIGLNCILPSEFEDKETLNNHTQTNKLDTDAAVICVPAIGLCWKF